MSPVSPNETFMLKNSWKYAPVWRLKRAMEWAQPKCAILHHQGISTESLCLGTRPVLDVDKALYLGVTLIHDGFSIQEAQQTVFDATKTLNRVCKSFRASSMSMRVKLGLVQTFVIPKFEYVLYLQAAGPLLEAGEDLLDKAMKWIASVSTQKLLARARAALGVSEVKVRRWRAAMSFIARLQANVELSRRNGVLVYRALAELVNFMSFSKRICRKSKRKAGLIMSFQFLGGVKAR